MDVGGRKRPAHVAGLVTALVGMLFGALGAGVLWAGPSAAAPPGPGYVALGDSYAAGIGAPPYPDPVCGRSENAYGPLLADSLRHTRFSFPACSGAKIADVEASQLGVLDRHTRLVTLTVGGNDIGFSPVLGACVRGTDADCAAAIAAADAAVGTLAPRLDQLYATVHRLAPRARLLVVGYPRLFELTPDCGGLPLSLAERTALNATADALDDAIAAAAHRSRAVFVDVRGTFAGHGICGADPWINGLTQDRDAFHPNAEGQAEGYYPAVRRFALPCRHGRGHHTLTAPVPLTVPTLGRAAS